MNKNNERPREMIITKESLRPACTRSKTPLAKEGSDQQESIESTEKHTEKLQLKKPRCRRQWIEWSGEEKRCFYEGLAEYGKDYGKIQGFMNKKLKLKNYADGKTKEQIRFFYHRTWSKISKSLNIQHEEDSKRSCRRDIHYLLCLSELRKKKSVGFGPKVMKQLDELVRKGFTYVRLNGRNLRIRPPNRYLKRLYRDVSDLPDLILPKSVTVEFLPNSNVSFNFVQQHAFNPRLRFTSVNIRAKFSEVFDMLNKRFTDLHESGKLNLYIYPLQPDIECSEFAENLSNAEYMLENLEKNQDLDIVLERSKNDRINETEANECNDDGDDDEDDDEDEDEEDKDDENLEDQDNKQKLENILPKIFGQLSESKNKVEKICQKRKTFPGYWTYTSSEQVVMRTLFVAFGKSQVLKFKYEWKVVADEKTSSFAMDSMRFLVNICGNGIRSVLKEKEKENQTKLPATPKDNMMIYEQKPIVPGIISTNQNGIVTTNNFALPFRPRPGRKRSVVKHSQSSPKSPIAPYLKSTNKLFKDIVAVNIIPQPPQLVQFAHLPPDSMKLVNSRSPSKFNKQLMQTGDVREEVMEEGFQEHFQSLTNMITSSTLIQQNHNGSSSNENKTNIIIHQTTPKKVHPTSKFVPQSPNLEWLNGESVDISLASFLNVYEAQAAMKNNNIMLKDNPTDMLMKCNNNFKTNGHTDPVLPTFHSGDTSQGPLYDLTFELSNQGVATKSRDQFSVT